MQTDAAPKASPSPPIGPPDIPLPPPRPPDLPTPPIAAAPTAGPAPTDSVAPDAACPLLLAGGKVEAHVLAPIVGTGACGIAAPVELAAIIVSPAERIRLQPPATVGCALAGTLADWVLGDLVPAFAASGHRLAALAGTSGYACRSRDNLPGAKLSEHATGTALDLDGFVTAGGSRVAVNAIDAPVLAAVRTTACARFTTVLGPGADSFHERHLHIDLAMRQHGFRLCQWDQPAPTPVAAHGPR